MTTIRIGILGCASVNTYALLDVIPLIPEMSVVAIASRTLQRATAYAAQHHIPNAYGSYAQLLADDAVNLVYIALPNGLHGEWALRALQAGKAVLCEKPLAANATEARRMADAAQAAGLPLIEGFHYRHHPALLWLGDSLRNGMLGDLGRVETRFQVPASWRSEDNIRLSYALGGGAMMDPGCYCMDLLRFVTGEEPQVVEARARLLSEQIDGEMDAELRFRPSGCTGHLIASFDYAREDMDLWLRITGARGVLEVTSPYVPHGGFTASLNGVQLPLTVDPTPSYVFQLRAVQHTLIEGASIPTDAENGVLNMRAIDAVYTAAGLKPRGTG